jgi:FKBP-type peptidyl-prolyl cis-trans isomerase FklB
MRRFLVVLVMVCLMPATAVFSQNELPQAGQPGEQQQPQGRPGFGQQPGQGFGNQPANGAAPGANDPVYKQQVSYGLGRNFAMGLKDNDIPVDLQALLAGISDTLRGAQPKWTEQQLDSTLRTFERQMQQQAAKNKQEEKQFLDQNGRAPGVQTTASGLQYKVLQQGKGPSPTLGDKVKCNYRGTLLSGTEFDSSFKRNMPAEFAIGQVIDGWKEALQKMHVGDKWQLFVPSKLAYDMEPPPRTPIEPGSMLVFEIELLDIAKQ